MLYIIDHTVFWWYGLFLFVIPAFPDIPVFPAFPDIPVIPVIPDIPVNPVSPDSPDFSD